MSDIEGNNPSAEKPGNGKNLAEEDRGMDIPATHRKLDEAWFFLTEHLKTWERPDLQSKPGVLEFYLSAFLSAAHSVTFALKKEAKDQYNSWWNPWREGLPAEDKKLLKFMNDQRVSEVHL